jgi:hypothetical protein
VYKNIVILTTSILCLGITSCVSGFRKVGSIAGSKIVQSAERKVGSIAGSIGKPAENEAISEVERYGGRIAAHSIAEIDRAKKKIYDAAYEAALDYFETQGRQFAMEKANEIASNVAVNQNRELGEVVGSATVTAISSSAVTAAYAAYEAKSSG